MADATYKPAVYRKQGGDELVVASGGKITIESGGEIDGTSGTLKGFPTAGVAEVALASTKIIVGGATGAGAAVSMGGDATIDNTGKVTIAAKAVTLAKMADLSQGSLISGQGSDRPGALDASGDGEILVGDGTDVNAVAVSGDATLANDGELTIAAKAVTAAKCGVDVVTAAYGAATTEEVNAGKTIVAAEAGTTLKIVDIKLQAKGGSSSGADSVDICDSDGTQFAQFPVAALTENAIVCMGDDAGLVTVTNIHAALAAGKGISIQNAGSALATATSINYVIEYIKTA
jgi:hypothetical protein